MNDYGYDLSEALDMIALDIGEDRELQSKWERARALMERGELKEAESYLRGLIDDRPSAPLWNSLVVVGFLSRKEDDIKIGLMNAQKLGPDHLSTLHLWGDVFRFSTTPELAIFPYQRAMELYPEHPRAFKMGGICLYEMERHTDASKLFRKAGLRNPSDDFVWCMLGVTLTSAGRLNRAAKLLKKYVKRYPKSYGLWFALGGVLSAQKKWHKAEKCFLRADKVNPGDPSIPINLAAIYRATGRPDAAVRAHRRAIELGPDHFTSWFSYGSYMMEMNCVEEGRKAFQRAIEISPEKSQDAFVQVREAFRRHGVVYGEG